jgi:3-oxoacyl-[acyl-carrier protein] reductase
VTGVVGGIGRAIARRLAEAGAEVTVTDRPGPDLDAAAAALGLPHIPADLGRREDVAALVARCRARPRSSSPRRGRSGAGGPPGGGGPRGRLARDLRRNVDSAFFLAQALAPAMKAAGFGRIVTISSGAGLRASLTGIQAYAASKHALVGLTRQLAAELGPHGITVNSVAPGFVLSNPASRAQWDSYGDDGQAAILVPHPHPPPRPPRGHRRRRRLPLLGRRRPGSPARS